MGQKEPQKYQNRTEKLKAKTFSLADDKSLKVRLGSEKKNALD